MLTPRPRQPGASPRLPAHGPECPPGAPQGVEDGERGGRRADGPPQGLRGPHMSRQGRL